MNGLAILLGCGIGVGLTLILRGLWPPRLSLADAMAPFAPGRALPPITALRGADSGPADRVLERLYGGMTATLQRAMPSAVRRFVPVKRHADLRVAGVTPARHLAEKVTAALAAGLIVGASASGAVLIPDFSLAAPLWVSGAAALIGFVAPDLAIRERVRQRRDEMEEVVAAFVYVASLSLSAGNGVQTALRDGLAHGDGWAWGQLRRAVAQAQYGRETSWQALGRLGEELAVGELQELSSRAQLAENDGARIQASLIAFAETLQSRRLATVERRERRNTLAISAACCLIAIGFALFLTLAAFGGILTS